MEYNKRWPVTWSKYQLFYDASDISKITDIFNEQNFEGLKVSDFFFYDESYERWKGFFERFNGSN